MAHVTLPRPCRETDLEMAAALARHFESEELFVFWVSESEDGEPLEEPAATERGALPRLQALLRGLGDFAERFAERAVGRSD